MKKIFLYFISIILVMTLTACGGEKSNPEKKDDKEGQAIIIEDQKIGDLSFESFNVVLDENNISHVYFEVINNGIETSNVNQVTFRLYKSNTEIVSITKNLNGPISSNDMRIVETSFDIDLTDVDKVEYSVE